MISVAVSGAAGRMGSLVAATVSAAADLELAACFDPRGLGTAGGRAVTADPADLSGADVVVEFTTPDVVMQNLAVWREMNLNAVVGTSGFDEARLAALTIQWGSGPPNCLVVPNFSIGAVLMMRFAEMAAPHFAASEVIELHHDRKADAPSGTALATAAAMRAAGGRQERAVESAELVEGARGADAGGVRVHAVRLPGLLAHQEVLLGSEGEVLTIRHDTTDRAAFMPGVLLGIRAVAGLTRPVTVGIQGLLGL
ncbi:MAG: 4-hydroxy-tetrahydrodipicolinate reductase [Actinobacteria bacterium]|nr:4-hydroxy-tetrahydrodipicolinate reductase [Actinomycetota bacterium]MBU1493102.1 4-hydroxy-tetrahydrodipicolinate reductase [Actinomycetota bacterium]MBU1864941.1 4-hydroxy-tetrahydrodipicolinate reductase [Actinomycetota bacterium]